MIVLNAPAKINLYLHIGPVRRDGLHDLSSLFVFAEHGDVIRAELAKEMSLRITGPFAGPLESLAPEKNLVFRAAALLAKHCGVKDGAAITLEKNLPIASGIGGGSADAAAALLALIKLWNIDISPSALSSLAFTLGADVPACLARAPVNVSGAGEVLRRGPVLPPLWICLANPRVEMPTGPIFCAFDARKTAPEVPACKPFRAPNYAMLKHALTATRNDLEPFAVERAPVIGEMVDHLRRMPGAIAARMSGSGATCFALFASPQAAQRTAVSMRARGWWSMASPLHVR
ncbi:4-(cytidine 5'-diphospho)-2-C-methyl-D-erythritol kinase [Hyphococcus sp.]|uniref:4-(cytidine 5'-diphospho)-2-C-methyl-D-erythritol kinase n=1 Tax=Hyphococcus sp. TaxID=2038636 RepID=UPI0020855192|nr:MAG: 4-diphosphocytidyl-2-C-methyl-D-erythritol kinase [Marinicaulis sp.]